MKKDYFLMIGELNDGFGDNGWADGYANIPSKHEEILKQLYRKIPNEELINYLDIYLQGYELGHFMSEETEKIYDEDGCLKEEEYSLDTSSHLEEAKLLLMDWIKRMMYGKLVRDNIPDIIKSNNEEPIIKILSDEEYKKELENKLIEECNEVLSSTGKDRIEELADMLEVIIALSELENKTFEDVEKVRILKKEKRGGFSKKIYLEDVK